MSFETLRIAVEGCCHGELNKIYAHITALPYEKWPELLIICGDFQSVRDETDLSSMAVPDKFKRLGDFQDYYLGKKKAPILTVFVGGNHEASYYLQDLPFGGWVAENIYYMGNSNVIWYKGIRIGGLSGIYKYFDLYRRHDEKYPYDESAKRSVYHVRFEDYLKLSLIRSLDINCFISHDWPEGITNHGDVRSLLKFKPFFKKDIQNNALGSVPARLLLHRLMPNWWFSAHLHAKFEAVVQHPLPNKSKRRLSKEEENQEDEKKAKVNNDEIDLGLEEDEGESNKDEIKLEIEDEQVNKDEINVMSDGEIALDLSDDDPVREPEEEVLAKGFSQTNFLALDKCLPKRKFLEFLNIPITNNHESSQSNELHYDREFLRITKWFETFQNTEVFRDLRIRDVTDGFVEQAWRDIREVKVADETVVVPQNFKSELENAKRQTEEFREKYLVR